MGFGTFGTRRAYCFRCIKKSYGLRVECSSFDPSPYLDLHSYPRNIAWGGQQGSCSPRLSYARWAVCAIHQEQGGAIFGMGRAVWSLMARCLVLLIIRWNILSYFFVDEKIERRNIHSCQSVVFCQKLTVSGYAPTGHKAFGSGIVDDEAWDETAEFIVSNGAKKGEVEESEIRGVRVRGSEVRGDKVGRRVKWN